MTEQDWVGCDQPQAMLAFLRDKVSDRKLRLFACACSRSIWQLLRDLNCHQTIEVAERFSDGDAEAEELDQAGSAAYTAYHDIVTSPAYSEASGVAGHPVAVAEHAAEAAVIIAAVFDQTQHPVETVLDALRSINNAIVQPDSMSKLTPQAALLRDIVNPFRPVTLDPIHRTSTILSLAQAAYEERMLPSGELDPTRLAVLADALEEVRRVTM